MNIGKSVNKALAERDMSRKELSEKSKISESHISQIVNGNFTPKISTIERLSTATDYSVSSFIALGE